MTDHTPTEELVAKLRRGADCARRFGVGHITLPVPVVEETGDVWECEPCDQTFHTIDGNGEVREGMP
jgi:hypothetical protein